MDKDMVMDILSDIIISAKAAKEQMTEDNVDRALIYVSMVKKSIKKAEGLLKS
ncbi:hypothetical protein D3C87_931610 [compost metagenome]